MNWFSKRMTSVVIYCLPGEYFGRHQSSAVHRPTTGAQSSYWSRGIVLARGPTISFRNVSRFCDDVYECQADNGASSGPAIHRVRLSVECKITILYLILRTLPGIFISRPFIAGTAAVSCNSSLTIGPS